MFDYYTIITFLSSLRYWVNYEAKIILKYKKVRGNIYYSFTNVVNEHTYWKYDEEREPAYQKDSNNDTQGFSYFLLFVEL